MIHAGRARAHILIRVAPGATFSSNLGSRYWNYEYLFAKQDRANIEDDELEDFRILAKSYATLTEKQIAQLLEGKDLTEICHGDEK